MHATSHAALGRRRLGPAAGAAAVAAAVALGLAAGAMLAEAAVLVTYWRSLQPQEFLGWYADNADRLLKFYGPLEAAAALLTLGAAVLARLDGRGRRWLLVASVCAIAVLLTFPLYFEDVNASFAAASIPVGDVSAELARWEKWHWLRIAMGIAAFVAAVLAVREHGA